MNRIFIVTNIDLFFLSNRKEQALVLKDLGYEIHVVSKDTGHGEAIKNLGFQFHNLPSSRFGSNVFDELSAIRYLFKIYRLYRPAIINHLGLKPILLGSIAGYWVSKVKIINTFTGLGYLFTIDTFKTRLAKKVLMLVFRILHVAKFKYFSIFQNHTDLNIFQKLNLVDSSNAAVIKGCGVDVFRYKHTDPTSNERLKILLPSKILFSKGIYEFVEAARILKTTLNIKCEFILCGGVDEGHPFAIKKSEVEQWQEEGLINWLGNQSNMADIFAQSHIVVLPSYREGLPRVLLEAGAVGRPIITTDVAGCNEVVENGVNGYIVPVKSAQKLAEAIGLIASDKELRITMGANSRRIIERDYELYNTINQNIEVYKKVLKR